MKFTSLLLLAAATEAARDTLANAGYHVNSACNSLTNQVTWDVGKTGRGMTYIKYCKYQPWLGTYTHCVEQFEEHEHVQDQAFDFLIKNCDNVDVHFTHEDLRGFAANATPYINHDANFTAINRAPVEFNHSAYSLSYRSGKEFKWQLDSGTYFGAGLVAWFALVILIGAVINFVYKAFPQTIFGLTQRPVKTFRQWFSLPATFGHKHSSPMDFKFIQMATPTRVQSFVVFVYIALNIIFMCICYDLFTPNSSFKTKSDQLARYVSDRSGIMAFTQLPLIFLFAGRNNIMMWITGWSFDTFNVYHRWVSRMMTIHAIIHSVGYTVIGARRGALKIYYSRTYWRWGVVATILCSFICIQSIYFLRHRWYDAFLFIHIVFAVMFVVGCWWHCEDLGWMQWVYASIALWCFDRLMRLVRMAWSGKSSGVAQIVGREARIVRIEVDYSQRWKFFPGAHVYLHCLKGTRKPWESHPFTIYQSPEAVAGNKITFLIKCYDGMTNSLFNYLDKNGKCTLPVLMDGPYGSQHPVHKYDTSILVAGGIGITATYAYAMDSIQRGLKQHIVFIWVVSDDEYLKWFSQELAYLQTAENIEVRLYLTRQHSRNGGTTTMSEKNVGVQETIINTSSSDEASDKASDVQSLSSMGSVQVNYGSRPDLCAEIPNIVSQAAGTTSVMVCGPPVMNDDTRKAVALSLDFTNKRVDYFEEAFAW
jgi:predicted ferric reductase